MNLWDDLNIKETDDPRLIKKAYGEQLGMLKVAADKEGIIRLKLNYKLILQLKNLQNKSIDQDADYLSSEEFDDLKHQRSQKNISDSIDKLKQDESSEKYTDNNVTVEESRDKLFSKKELSTIEDFISHINLVALQKHRQPLNLSHWKFIKFYKRFIDESLQKHVEQKVFSLIANININAVQENAFLLVPMRVIGYMAKVFDWDNQLEEYKKKLDIAEIHIMYPETRPVLDRVKRFSKPVSIKKSVLVDLKVTERLGVFILQMLLYSTPVLIYYYFTNWTLYELVKHVFISDMIIRFVLEIFSNPVLTLSEKNIEGQTFIVREDKGTPEIFQTLVRHFVINLTFFPVYAWLFGYFSSDNIVIYNYTINYELWTTIMINIITANILSILIYGKLFHDLLTKTYAVKLRLLDKI